MIRNLHSVRGIARQISSAADGALDVYRSGRVEEEPQITDRIIGAIENRVGLDSPLAAGETLEPEFPDDTLHYTSMAVEGFRDRMPGLIVWSARSLRTSRGALPKRNIMVPI